MMKKSGAITWLLPRLYEAYPIGFIPSIRRNLIISACLDVTNLMERGETGLITIVESYKDAPLSKQPVVSSYPGFLSLKLYDLLYSDEINESYIAYKVNKVDNQKVVLNLLASGPKTISELQSATYYKSRSTFWAKVIQPLLDDGKIRRDGNLKSPYSMFVLQEKGCC